MVGTDVALPAVVVIGPQDLDDAGLAAAIPVGSLAEVAVVKVMDVADVGKGNPGMVLADTRGRVSLRSLTKFSACFGCRW